MCFSCIPKEAAAEIIGQFGGVQDLLSAMRAFPNNKAIASNCCGALWSLAVSGMARLREISNFSEKWESGQNKRKLPVCRGSSEPRASEASISPALLFCTAIREIVFDVRV